MECYLLGETADDASKGARISALEAVLSSVWKILGSEKDHQGKCGGHLKRALSQQGTVCVSGIIES